MVSEQLKHILCVLRGRPESRATVTRAIELALEHDARLTFAHVLNADFLGSATPTMTTVQVIYRQLQSMSEFTMELLCDWAKRQGVKNVDFVLRSGNAGRQLFRMVDESGADSLVIGKPLEDSGIPSILTPEEFEAFVTNVEQKLNVRIFQVDTKIDNHLRNEDLHRGAFEN